MIRFFYRINKIVFLFFVILFAFFIFLENLLAETVGIIMPGNVSYYREIHNAFLNKLKREGYGERVNIVLQKPYPDYISLSNAARKLDALGVDLIIAYGTNTAMAVIHTKTKVPLIYACITDSFAQKIRGRNITGISYRIFPSSLLRYIREITTIKSVGIIYSTNDPDSVLQMEDIRRASEQYGIKAELIIMNTVHDAKRALKGRNIDAVFITQSPVIQMALTEIIDIARARRMLTASLLPGISGHYPTIALYVKEEEIGDRIVEMMTKILGGLPADKVKVSCCDGVELAFNLKEVKEMGYRIPSDLVVSATRLIQ